MTTETATADLKPHPRQKLPGWVYAARPYVTGAAVGGLIVQAIAEYSSGWLTISRGVMLLVFAMILWPRPCSSLPFDQIGLKEDSLGRKIFYVGTIAIFVAMAVLLSMKAASIL